MFKDIEKEMLQKENEYLKKLVDRLLLRCGIAPITEKPFDAGKGIRKIGEATTAVPTKETYGGADD
jgi:hypothetical protein